MYKLNTRPDIFKKQEKNKTANYIDTALHFPYVLLGRITK